MKGGALLLGALTIWPIALRADELPIAYECKFTEVTRATIEYNQLAPWETGKELYPRTYTPINLEKNTAIAIGETGADENVYVERSGSKLNFIEHSKSGNIFLTTIMDPDAKGKSVIVTSGHKVVDSIPGLAFFVQNLGTCDAKF